MPAAGTFAVRNKGTGEPSIYQAAFQPFPLALWWGILPTCDWGSYAE
jgi:hypothetical protein